MKRIDKYYMLAYEFRRAIDIIEFETIPMKSFPAGCCGTATMLLSQYYIDKGVNAWYQNGNHYSPTRGYSQSHAWVVLDNGIIADITGDQFAEDSEYGCFRIPVCVGKETAFHKMFVKEQLKPGGFRCYDEETIKRCELLYKKILQSIYIWNNR